MKWIGLARSHWQVSSLFFIYWIFVITFKGQIKEIIYLRLPLILKYFYLNYFACDLTD